MIEQQVGTDRSAHIRYTGAQHQMNGQEQGRTADLPIFRTPVLCPYSIGTVLTCVGKSLR